MKPTITLITIIFLSACCMSLQAQQEDRIITRDGETISCKIVEVGYEEVAYTLAQYNHEVRFTILKSTVDRIVFANGQELVIDHAERARESAESNSADLFLVQKKNALKVDFLTPINGVTGFSYERALKPGRTVEGAIGIIGLGFNNPGDAAGVGIKAGYKFLRSPDFYLKGMRYAHILKGGYVKPELAFATYSLRTEDRNVTKLAIMLNIGKQWVFSDAFLVDLFFGLGYGYSSAEGYDDWPHYFAVGTDNVPLAVNWGFRVGFAF
jgi:hypothetical protein